MTHYWLVKSEPNKYPFEQLLKEGATWWDGVRNFEARGHLRAMKRGEQVLFYHSNIGKAVVGIAQVTETARPDPTAPDEEWSVVQLKPLRALTRPVTLAEIKQDPALTGLPLITRSRLSVTPVSEAHFNYIVRLSEG